MYVIIIILIYYNNLSIWKAVTC